MGHHYTAVCRRLVCCLAMIFLVAGIPDARFSQAAEKKQETSKPEAPPQAPPSLGSVLYRAGTLNQELSALKSKPGDTDQLQQLAQRLKQAAQSTDRLNERLSQLRDNDLQNYQQLVAIKAEAKNQAESVRRATESLTELINQIEANRQKWMNEKQKWNQWHQQLATETSIKSVSAAISRARDQISEALAILARQLEPLIAVQQQAGDTGTRIANLIDQVNGIMALHRGGTFRGDMPNMLSWSYLDQLIDLSRDPKRLFQKIIIPTPGFLVAKKWLISLQAAIFFGILALLRHYRDRLTDDDYRRLLEKRPVSLSLFVALFGFSFFYGSPPIFWQALVQTIAGVVTARLAAAFVQQGWIKRSIYILILVLISFQMLLVTGVPLAVMRVFLLFWSLAGVIYFGWRAHRQTPADRPAWQTWLLRLVSIIFLLIAVTNIFGLGNFAVQIMDSALRSAVLVLMGWVMIRLARVVLDLTLRHLPIGGMEIIRRNTAAIQQKVLLLANLLIIGFISVHLLVAWKLFSLPAEAVQAFFAIGITVGSTHVTIAVVLTAALILYGAFILSWALQSVLMENVLNRRQIDAGSRLSIMRLIHYALVLVGFLIALSALGFELKNVTIIGGALGVGIGFGMQAIVNNFVSGLILLFERPIKVGDVIQLNDDRQGRVINLGLRATTVQTFDRAEIVVPNGDLISSPVTNWTLGDRSMRLIIPVGVAYGSDVEKVMKVLMSVAHENTKVLKNPTPMVLFLNFGDSSLDFQLRVWIADFDNRRILQSELFRDIDRRFRAEGIEIPFPQRDLHLRSEDIGITERSRTPDRGLEDH